MVNKREFYGSKEVVEKYLEQRYGGPSGQLVWQHENDGVKKLLADLLKDEKTIVDAPAGTGRLKSIIGDGHTLIGVDYSELMIKKLAGLGYDKIVQADAADTGLAGEIADIVIQLRFYFHYENIKDFILEAKRLLKPGGYLIFDTLNWSPRQISFKIWQWRGGKIFIHSREEIMKLLNELGFEFVAREDRFLFSPYLHRQLPLAVVKFLIYMDKFIPSRLKVATFWRFKKLSD